jgi:hypothetical protein
MPGPRCIFDGVLLPNGHVVLLGGQRVRGGWAAGALLACWRARPACGVPLPRSFS